MRRLIQSAWDQLKLRPTLVRAFGYVFGFSFFVNLLILTSPIYMMQVFDRVLVTGRVETLVYLTLIAGVALVVLGMLEGVRSQLLNRVGSFIDQRLRSSLLTHSIAQSRVDGANHNHVLDDLSSFRGYVGSPAVLPMLDAPWVPLFIAVIAVLHPWLAVLATAAAVVLFILALANDRLSRDLVREASKFQASAGQMSNAAYANADIIHAMGMQQAVSGRYGASIDRMVAASQRAADRGSILTSLSKAIRIAVQVGILALGAYLVIQAELTPGGMIAASIILGRALAPVEQSIGSWRQFRTALDAYRRLKEFLLDRPALADRISLPGIVGNISAEEASYRVPGTDKVIVQRVSFQLSAGTVLAVVGPSASGKSTLCKLMVGSWAPTLGHVRLDGADAISLRPEDMARNIGYLPQDVELFSGTVKDNIARLGQPDDTAVVEAARAAGCHDMILHLPDGYETELGPQGMFLSGGQRQRIALARAFYGNPSVIVLDEPNASLDQEGEVALVEAIKSRKQAGATVVIVSHRFSMLQPVDKMAVMRNGRLERFGDRDEVLAELAPKPVQRNTVEGQRGTGAIREENAG